MNPKGKRVLVTGGSSGVGFATAQATTAAGARVFIVGRRRNVVAKAVEAPRASGVDAAGLANARGRS